MDGCYWSGGLLWVSGHDSRSSIHLQRCGYADLGSEMEAATLAAATRCEDIMIEDVAESFVTKSDLMG